MSGEPLIDTVKAFLAAISSGESIAHFLAPEVVQIEYSNRLLPTGAARDFRAICEGQEKG